MHKRVGYWSKVFNGMSIGLFGSLIVGLILRQIGTYLDISLFVQLGRISQLMMGPAIAAGIARSIGAPPLVIFASLVVGAVGVGTFNGAQPVAGEPVGAHIGKLVSQRRWESVEILLIPLATIICGGLAGVTCAPWIAKMMSTVGSFINMTTTLNPIPMGILVSTIMGMILTLPISSAALAISLGLSGLAAGASAVGCSTQMIGFAVISYRENGVGGLISQGIGTSMIQVPNIIQNPWIWLPPILTSAILGPLSTVLFQMKNNSVGAGMGTSGLVGQLGAFAVMGKQAWPGVIMLHFILPMLLCCFFAHLLRVYGLLQPGDMKIEHDR